MKLYSATTLLVLALLLAGVTTLFAGYIEDREAAVALMRKGEVQAAVRAFNKMAQGDVTELQKSDALEQAVLCQIRLKQLDAAKQTADKIPLQGVSDLCHMRILATQGKHDAIVDQFGNAKIGEWPPMWRGHGYLLRGNAAYQADHGKLAASDLEEAAHYAATFGNPKNDKARLLNTLGSTYRDLLKEDEKAIDAFQRGQAVGSSSKGTSATFAIADIYLEKGQPEKAVAVVKDWTEKVRPQDFGSASWQNRLLLSTMRVFAAAGRKDEAIAVGREALGLEQIHPSVKEAVRAQIAELQGTGTGREE